MFCAPTAKGLLVPAQEGCWSHSLAEKAKQDNNMAASLRAPTLPILVFYAEVFLRSFSVIDRLLWNHQIVIR